MSIERQETQERSVEEVANYEILNNIRGELESLKESIESSTEQDFSLKDDILSFLDRFNQSFGRSVEQIERIKQDIESKSSLEIEDIQQINEFLSSLTQEQIENLEDDRLEEAYSSLQDTSRELSNLADDISSNLEEAEENIYNTAKEEGGILGFVGGWIGDKYTARINEGKSVNSGIWGFGLTAIGWFSSDFKDSILGYKEIKSAMRNGAGGDSAPEINESELESMKENFQEKTKEQLSEEFDIDIDDDSFQRALDRRYEEYDFADHFSSHYDKFNDALNGEGTFDSIGSFFSVLGFGSKALLGLIQELNNEGIISYGEIGFSVIEKGGKTFIQYGKSSVGLIGAGFSTVFGEMELDDFVEFAQQNFANIEGMDPENRAAILGILYRHGGLLSQVMSTVGKFTGYIATLPLQLGEDVGRFSTALGHATNNLDSQLKSWNRLSEAFGAGEMFPADVRNNFLNMSDSVKLSHALSKSNNIDDLNRILPNWRTIGEKLNLNKLDIDTSNFSRFKRELGGEIGFWYNRLGESIENINNGWQRTAARVPGVYTQTNEFAQLANYLKRHGDLTRNYLSNPNTFAKIRQTFAKYTRAAHSMEMVDRSESARFSLNSVEDVRGFARDVRYMARRAPELMGHLFGNLPLVFLGPEMYDSFQDAENMSEGVKAAFSDLLYIFPMVGSFMLLKEGLSIEDGGFKDPTLAGTAILVAGVDSFFYFRSVPTYGVLGAAGRQMAMPAIQLGKFVGSMPGFAYDTYKFMDNSIRRVSSQGIGASWKNFAANPPKGFKGRGGKVGAAMAVAGILAGYAGISMAEGESVPEDIKNSIDDPEALDDVIKNNWEDFNKEERQAVVKIAFLYRMGMGPEKFDENGFDVILSDDGTIEDISIPPQWVGEESSGDVTSGHMLYVFQIKSEMNDYIKKIA